jgi:2-phospho-L-lactate guanylyltransferase
MVSVAPVTILVPVKAAGIAKSRLKVPAHRRADLVQAMAQDVLDAARATGLPVLVVSGGPDLDTALTQAAIDVAGPVVVVMADLPCLRASDLLAVLAAAAETTRWVVGDTDGNGTALLGAHRGSDLRPSYGVGSRHRHAQGATDLTDQAPARARRDVDVLADLDAAAHLGLGPCTASVHLGLP